MSAQDVPAWLKITGAMLAIIAPIVAATVFVVMQVDDVEASAKEHASEEIRQSERRIERRLSRIEDKLDRLIERGH